MDISGRAATNCTDFNSWATVLMAATNEHLDRGECDQPDSGDAAADSGDAAALTVATVRWEPAQPAAELIDELAQVSDRLESATPQQILSWAHERFAPRLTMGTAFGPEGMTIIHMLAEIAPDTLIFNLDTGYQFPETVDMKRRIFQRYGIDIEFKRPQQTVAQFEAAHGGPVYKKDPNQCCFHRKIVVLRQAIAGMDAWISAIRRDQSPDRARAPIVGWDKKFGLVKVNPLANSSKQSVWKMITDEDVPYNPLHDQGYTSIGCQPCTRAVMLGEDERAGRWSGTAKTECGLHSLDDAS